MDSLLLPLFALAGLALPGLAGERSRILELLTAVTLRALIPALLFLRLYDMAPLEEPPWRLLLAYYVPAAIVFVATGIVLTRWARQPVGVAVVGALSAAFGNVVLTGIPVVEAFLGPEASAPMLTLISVHSLLLLPGASLVLAVLTGTGSGRAAWRAGLAASLRNPVLAGIALGVACRMAGIDVATPVRGTLAALGAAGGPAAMLVLGGACARLPRARPSRPEALAVAAKTLLHPALVALACFALGVDTPGYALVAVLLAAQPTGVNAVIFAGADTLARVFASRVVVASTALALLVVVPAIIAFGG